MFVEMRAVEITKPSLVFGKMCRDPIDDYSDAALMKAIHQVHEIRGRAEAAGGSVIADDFISPGAVEGEFHDGKKFDMRITRLLHIVGELHRHFPVSQPTVSLLRHSPPGAEMDFIDGDGALKSIAICAVRHPLAISPRIGAEVPHPGGSLRADFRGKCVRIRFIYFITLELRRNVILVQRTRPCLRHKALPYSGCTVRRQRIRPRVPVVEVSQYADLPGIRRPHGEMNARQ